MISKKDTASLVTCEGVAVLRKGPYKGGILGDRGVRGEVGEGMGAGDREKRVWDVQWKTGALSKETLRKGSEGVSYLMPRM